MAWTTTEAVQHNGSQVAPPRHKISPQFIATAVGWEGKPRWTFREGLYRMGPYGFPPQILDLPVDEAVALARRCCNLPPLPVRS